jgi:hypothetical protein
MFSNDQTAEADDVSASLFDTSNILVLTKDRHILRKNWDSLRADFESIIKDNRLPATDFKALSIYDDHKVIEEHIYRTFCRLDHPTQRPIWLWEHFKLDTFLFAVDKPYKYLSQLIDNEETIWFFANGDKDKFWSYEGKVNAIETVIEESTYIDELYLASKKYQWLVCINHHDDLIATGQVMPDKLRQLKVMQNSQ